MNYIKAAVELAEGFEWDIERDVIVDTQYGQLNMAKDEPLMLDHLAAQLERQYAERARLTQWLNYSRDFRRIPKESANELTMWRIGYFVDSGVLAATEQRECDKRAHVYYECPDDCDVPHCPYCQGGLAYCINCKKGEGDLAESCPATEQGESNDD